MKRSVYAILLSSVLILGCRAEEQETSVLRETGRAFTRIARTVTPAVVSIRVEQTVTQQAQEFSPFAFFFGPQFRQQPQQDPREPKSAC